MATPDKRDPMVKAIEVIAGRMLADIGDHPVALQLQAEVNRLRRSAEALDNVNSNRSPLDTAAAHALKVAGLARKFGDEVGAMMNRSAQVWAQGFKDAQLRIDEKVDLRPDAFAGEIRTAFRGLSSKAKGELVARLVKENRGPELAAIVKAPSVLTGISDEERATFEQSIVARHATAEVDEQAKLEDVFQSAMAARKAAARLVKDLTNPVDLAEIERGAAAAGAAGDDFAQSLEQQ